MKFKDNKVRVGSATIERFKTAEGETFFEISDNDVDMCNINGLGGVNKYDTYKHTRSVELAILKVQAMLGDRGVRMESLS